jgi:CheY-like chemotaxis protein
VEAGIIREEMPVLALIDLRLPGDIDGVMVAERLRASSLLKDIAVVLMTAYHLDADEEKSTIQRAEADLLMYKPLPSFTELRDILRDIAQRRMNGKKRMRA